jgi:hypothetical protein
MRSRGVYFFEDSGISKVMSNRFSANWLEFTAGADRDHHNRVAAPTY